MNTEALKLLQTDREALLETPLAQGRRYRATLGRVVANDLLVVRVPAPLPRGVFPGASDIRVSVPEDGRLWSFTCSVLSCMHTRRGLLAVLRWPARAEQLPGRTAPRAQIALPLRFRPQGAADAPWTGSYTLDLSSTGMRFAAQADVRLGERLEVRIGLGAEPITGTAEVAWQRSLSAEAPTPGLVAGVRFDGLPDSGRRRLATLVEAHLARAA